MTAASGTADPRALVADAGSFFREAICETLQEAGIACAPVADAPELFEACRDARIGVVLLDVNLPEVKATEVVRALRVERPELRVIALSSRAGHAAVLDVLRAGASDYLAKPLHDEELVLAVRRALAAHDAEALLQEQLGAQAEAAELTRAVCEAVASELEPERVFAAALGPVARRLGCEAAALFRIEPGSGDLVLEYETEVAGPGERERLPRERGLTAGALRGALVATQHPERDPRFDAEVDTASDGAPRPMLCVPLELRGKVLGIFRAFPAPGAHASAELGEALAAPLAAAFRCVLLYRNLLDSFDELVRARNERAR